MVKEVQLLNRVIQSSYNMKSILLKFIKGDLSAKLSIAVSVPKPSPVFEISSVLKTACWSDCLYMTSFVQRTGIMML